MNERVAQYQSVPVQALVVFLRRNQDYGDAFARHGAVGVLVCINDKIQRVVQLSRSGIQVVDSKALCDAAVDLHNYSALLLMLVHEDGARGPVPPLGGMRSPPTTRGRRWRRRC